MENYKDQLDYSIFKICNTCKKMFFKKKCQSNKRWTEQKVCSWNCRRYNSSDYPKQVKVKSTNTEYYVGCKYCGKKFQVESEYYFKKRNFCSKSHAMKHKNPIHSYWTDDKRNEKSKSMKKLVKKGKWINPIFVPGALEKRMKTNREFPLVFTKERLELQSKLAADNIINGKNENLGCWKWGKIGIFKSEKNNIEIRYRSNFEKRAFEILENDDTVIKYETESFHIPYVMNDIKRRYIPDLLVYYKNTKRKLVEVKPLWKMNDEEVILKKEAGIKYCNDNNIEYGYEIWTEVILFPGKKINGELNDRLR